MILFRSMGSVRNVYKKTEAVSPLGICFRFEPILLFFMINRCLLGACRLPTLTIRLLLMRLIFPLFLFRYPALSFRRSP